MKPRKNKNVLYFFIIVALISLFITRQEIQPAEQMDVEVALGTDLEKISEDNYRYIITRSSYVFGEEKKQFSKVIVSKGNSFAMAREVRQQYADKSSISGMEKVYILNEEYARYGIRTSTDIIFKNPRVNDTGIFVVSKDKSVDIMRYEIPGYPSSADFIEGLIKNQEEVNFFSDEFDAMNIYVRLDSEGRSVILPYIEIDEEGIILSGEALFKEDKMVSKVDMKDARIMNMLKYNDVRGIVTLQNSGKEYVDFSARTNRKVKCIKIEDKYNFIIDITLKGQVITNTLSNYSFTSAEAIKEFEDILAKQVKKECKEFIGKMKEELEVDCLDLGRVAAAKYGRRKGNNWNKIISNSAIEINVKVKVQSQGRGDF